MASTTVFHITDLGTLGYLRRHISDCSFDRISPPFSWIRKLHLTLKLPLSFFRALENPIDDPDVNLQLTLWSQLSSAIEQLKELRILYIWFDHQDPASWSVVNERILLAGIASLAINDIQVDLPKLHPGYETPDRHFTEVASLPFRIQRRQRQVYFNVKYNNGYSRIKYSPDFPNILDHPDFVAEFSPEEIEEMERIMWKKGYNVHMLLCSFGCCLGYDSHRGKAGDNFTPPIFGPFDTKLHP